jgi:predicted lipid-binding transport protein (Tim44 family)
MNFDPLNLLLLAVALVVFWRLRSVLGTRTGNERPPIDPFGTKPADVRKPGEAQGTVVRFPQNEEAEPRRGLEPEPAEPVWKGYAEEGSDLARTFERMAESDPSFTPRSFVDGAKMAYEMIIEGFAQGDRKTLKNLLSKEVFDGFSAALDSREAAGQRVESRFVGIDKATIAAASLIGNKASITMEFVSELISATYAKSGELVDGDPKEIREVTDVWTFERDVTSRDPNWKLSATQAPA